MRQALRAWEDSSLLGAHPLAGSRLVENQRRQAGYRQTTIGYGVALREVLRRAVKALAPAGEEPDPLDRRWRPYHLLNELYLSRRESQALMDEMGIADSTFYHEQARALDALVERLKRWELEVSLESESQETPLAPFMAPVPPQHSIIGRQELLASLRARLLEGQGASLALSGLPGVGKTALAILLANDPQINEHFKDGVLWASLGQKPDVMAWLGLWATALEMPPQTVSKLDTMPARLQALHARIGSRQMLLVLDDVWQLEAAMTFRIGGPHCAYLLTTRSPRLAAEFAPQHARAVDALHESLGIELLATFVPELVEAEPEQAHSLVRAMGGLPLALVLIGHHLRVEARSGQPRRLRSALQHLESAAARMRVARVVSPLERPADLPPETPLSLLAAIRISDETLSEEQRQALGALSIFPPNPNHFDERAALAVSGSTLEVLDGLLDHGLLQSIQAGRYTLHQTIAAFASQRLDLLESGARFIGHYVDLIPELDNHPERMDAELVNILAALELALEQELDQLFVRGALEIAPLLAQRGLVQEASEKLAAAQARTSIESHPDEWHALKALLGKLALQTAAYDQAEAEFQAGLEQAQDRGRQKYRCIYTQGLGVVAFQRGDVVRAGHLLVQAYELAQEHQFQAEIVGLMLDLGVLKHTQGDLPAAESWFDQALRAARQRDDRSREVAALVNHGVLLARRGERQGAELAFREAHEIAIGVGQETMLASILTNLGALAKERGNGVEAEQHFLEALSHARRVDDRARASHLLANLGALASADQRFAVAQERLEESLQIAEAIGHAIHRSQALTNLGALALAQGRLSPASLHIEAALQVADNLRVHRLQAILWGMKGELAWQEDRIQEAQACYERALMLAEDEPQAKASALYGLARIAHQRGDFEYARQAGREALEGFNAIGDSRGGEVQRFLRRLETDAV